MTEKISNARIKPRIEGIKSSKEKLKAVVYSEEGGEIKVLYEKAVDQDELDLDLKRDIKDLPETVKFAVVPAEIKSMSLIRRLVQSDKAPSAVIKKDLFKAREGIVAKEDFVVKGIDELIPIWKLKRKVCGRVVKYDPIFGKDCPVPGATVHILDVDVHFMWWYPYPGWPWCWLFPILIRREEIATTTTDECGRFCVDIPFFDIDAILRWRLRFRCLWDLLKPPRVIDAIDLGVKPDLRAYPGLEHLPEMKYRPKSDSEVQTPVIPIPPPDSAYLKSSALPTMSQFYTEPEFEIARRAVSKELFEPIAKDKQSVMEKAAFPMPISPPALPDDEKLLKLLPDKRMIAQVRKAKPILRLLPCWAEIVPELRLFLDVPDIVFMVEQDVNGDGNLETIYDQGFFDVNWNLQDPTTNVVIEAWGNAICVPCGAAGYQPCTTTGIVGINDMAIDAAYLKDGYAVRVNRPKPIGAARPDAETPFCGALRLVGCPGYSQAAFYRVFYSYMGSVKAFKESWHEYRISTRTLHQVFPDSDGFYSILTPANDYYPYHTLINWPTSNYPNGEYKVRLELYDAGHNPILPALPEVDVVVDNSRPSVVEFLSLRWKQAGTPAWNSFPSLDCPVIFRMPTTAIDLEVTYNVAADHLRDLSISLVGCKNGSTTIGSDSYWHTAVNDNNKVLTWTVTVPGTAAQGAYYFYLEGRSRAFDATGGLAVNWEFDPLHIYRGRTLNVAIIDS